MGLVCPPFLHLDDPDLAIALFWEAVKRYRERKPKMAPWAVDEPKPPAGMQTTRDTAKQFEMSHLILNVWAREGTIEGKKFLTQRGPRRVTSWFIWPDEVQKELESGRHPQVGSKFNTGNSKQRKPRVFAEPPTGMQPLIDVAKKVGLHKDTLRKWIRKDKIRGEKYYQWRGKFHVLVWFVWPEEIAECMGR